MKTDNKIINFTKNNLISILFLLFAIFLVLFTPSNLNAARNGLKLWANNVVPSLFPFFVAVELLKHTSLIYIISNKLTKYMKPLFNLPGISTFPFVMGLISGYPIGAKIISDLYSNNSCTKKEAQSMLSFCNNSGPLFIIGTIGCTFYGSSTIGVILLITHIMASISIGLINGFISRLKNKENFKFDYSNNIKTQNSLFNSNNKDINFSNLGEVLSLSVLSGIKSILMLGGFVTLFSVILSILERIKILTIISSLLSKLIPLDKELINGFLTGIIEFTNGLNKISLVHQKNISINLILSAFVIGFGGISVSLQVSSIISKCHLSIKKYLISKIFQGILAAFYTLIILSIPMFNFNI